MTEIISQRELRNDSGRILRGLDEGKTYIVTRHSQPVGELRPMRRRRFVPVTEVTDVFSGAPRIDASRFFDDLDEHADQGVDPRG